MHFYLQKGKPHLDLTGNIILSNNTELVTAFVKSACPKVHNGKYIKMRELTFKQRLIATFLVLRFIWGGNGVK